VKYATEVQGFRVQGSKIKLKDSGLRAPGSSSGSGCVFLVWKIGFAQIILVFVLVIGKADFLSIIRYAIEN
jgi:hypothetical protein